MCETLPGPPGLLIGYSDITVLHCAWHIHGWGETLYGFLPGVKHSERARITTLALIRGEGCDYNCLN
jgi:muramoyltetrapeptide carboxypeptidase LdcA involved in peptidoglycan recycling